MIVRGRAGEGAGERWGAQALGRAGRSWQASGRRAGVARRARGRADGGARGACGAGPAGRQARGLGAGRAAWAPGLALGCALGALGPFSIRFDSFFFLSHQMNTVHCKIKFFSKKINNYIY